MIEYECPECGAEMESPESMAGRHEECPECGSVNTVPQAPSARAGGMKQTGKMVLAVFVCAIVFFLYFVLSAAMGWRYGGGIIPLLCLFGALGAAYRAITAKETGVAKAQTKKLLLSGGLLGLAIVISGVGGHTMRRLTTDNRPDADRAPIMTTPVDDLLDRHEKATALAATKLPHPPSDLPAGWQRVKVPDVGSIDIPPTMEVKSERLRKAYGALMKPMLGGESEGRGLIVQQAGLNANSQAAMELYVRVMISTERAAPAEIGRLGDEIDLPESDAIDLEQAWKTQLARLPSTKLLDFERPRIEVVNGMPALRMCWTRQWGSKPPVLVVQYIFQNYDRIHTLTLSYRPSEADRWAPDMLGILKSFRIIPAHR